LINPRAVVAARQQDTLGHVLGRAARLFHERALAAVHEAGFPEVQPAWIGLLRHLDEDGVRSSVLAERLGVTPQAAGQLVSELQARGYLERVPDPADGRAKLVRMTDRGWAAWAAGLQALNTLQAELAAAVGSDSIDTLLRVGLDLVAALEAPCKDPGHA
jgi:DNA-binding MarR family transcriptional regulator